jgi:hypothetical protein
MFLPSRKVKSPSMPAWLKRRVAFVLLTLLALVQANAALASCPMANAAMPAAMAGEAPCEGCDTMPLDTHDQIPSVCAAYCASSDQPAAVAATIVLPSPQRQALVLPRFVPDARPTGLEAAPSGAPPHRILLHSFLI